MNTVILQENISRENLYPFTLTRSTADIRVGIFTIREKWEKILEQKVQIDELPGEKNRNGQLVVAANHVPAYEWKDKIAGFRKDQDIASIAGEKILNHTWEIFELNDWAIRQDFEWIKKNHRPVPPSQTNRVIQPENLFIEPDANIEHCILNAENGPIYIGRGAFVMEGSMIRGPVAICDGTVVKMGTTLYGATTIGPHCIVGGEIKNVVIFGYSNKSHHGYLGDSVIGEWCNLGAGTSNSNMKNTASPVKVWNAMKQDDEIAGIKCGLLMGDYSRCAINTSFNTGTVVGICANIFNSGELTGKYIPNFSWGGKTTVKYEFEKAITEIRSWMKMKDKLLSEEQVRVLKHIFDHS